MGRVGWLVGAGLFVSTALAQTPSVADGGVLNGASFARGQPVAPGSLVSIFGTDLASTLAQADTVPLSTSLGGVSVTFNGISAPLLAVIPGSPGNAAQINAQLPWEVPPGDATVVVTRDGVPSAPKTIQVTTFSPGIFSVKFGVGPAIAINTDGSLAAPSGSIPGFATHPAKAGDALVILATGFGPVNPPAITGASSLDALRTSTTTPTLLVGGVPAQVIFSGMSPQFVGVNQVNIVVPPGVPTGDAIPLQIQLGGITTTDQVTIAIQ